MILVSCPHSSSESYIVFWYIMQNDYYSKGGPTSVRLAVCEKKLKRKTMKLSWGGGNRRRINKRQKMRCYNREGMPNWTQQIYITNTWNYLSIPKLYVRRDFCQDGNGNITHFLKRKHWHSLTDQPKEIMGDPVCPGQYM